MCRVNGCLCQPQLTPTTGIGDLGSALHDMQSHVSEHH